MGGAIDIMNYAPFVAPGLSGPEYQFEEFQTMRAGKRLSDTCELRV